MNVPFPISWTRLAEWAVAKRVEFLLDKGNPLAAAGAAKAIADGVDFLAENPFVGRKMEDMPEGYRRWFVRFGAGGYSILYRTHGDILAILSVKHSLEREYPGIDEIREQIENDE